MLIETYHLSVRLMRMKTMCIISISGSITPSGENKPEVQGNEDTHTIRYIGVNRGDIRVVGSRT